MRMHTIGSALPKSWSPNFSPIGKKSQKNSKKVRRWNGGPVMSYYPTHKGGARLEKLRRTTHAVMAELLDADPTVIRWTSSPAPIRDGLSDDEGFVPHFTAELRDGRQRAIKILRSSSYGIEAQQALLEVGFSHMGVEFELLSEKQLSQHPMREVARTLFKVRPMDVPDGLLIEALSAILEGRAETLGELLDQLEDQGASWPNILTLVSRGHIEVAWGVDLDRNTPVVGCSPEGWAS